MQIIVLLSALLLSFNSFADCKTAKEFYLDHERGWFYKEVCEEEKQEKKTKKEDTQKPEYRLLTEKVLNIPWDKINELDPDEIQKLHEKARKIVVMYPTDHNIKQYQKLVNWIGEKSETFMVNWMKVSRTDTELAREASEVTTSSAGRQQFLIAKANYKKQVLNQFKDRAGLVVITKEGCPYCQKQEQILRWFQMETGWEYRLVDIHSVPNIVRKFGVARVPDIFLVVKSDNGKPVWIRIGTGLHTKDELGDIILFGLYNLGLIQPPDKTFVLY